MAMSFFFISTEIKPGSYIFFLGKKAICYKKPSGEKKLQQNEKILLTFGFYEDAYVLEAIKCLHAGSVEI